MILKNVDLELKDGTQITASVEFYIEAFNDEEAIGHIEEIRTAKGTYFETEDLTDDSLSELQYTIDSLAAENAYEYWYEARGADAYDQAKDARYDD